MIDSLDEIKRIGRNDVFANREFPFTHRDFQQIAAIMQRDVGISLPNVKAPLVYSRLVRRLRSLGLESFQRYCALVAAGDGVEREQMIAALTTNVTRFFREKHHFEHFKAKALPDLLQASRKGARLRFWSAGCSSGEEPYSIALSILSLMPDAANFDIKILATDINRNVLETARKGIYGEPALASLDRKMRTDYFIPLRAPDGRTAWRAGGDLRDLVSFRELNLISDWPMRQSYHAVFCRNVAIYFEESLRAKLWKRIASLLAPKGYLYIGHSERISDALGFYETEGNTVYRLTLNA
jgi:chemotaxis protein methyltransferase CheR